MIVSSKKIDQYIKEWNGASKSEMKSRLKAIQHKNTPDAIAEKKALIALIA